MAGEKVPDIGSMRAQADGLLAWWALAGVDTAVDEENVDWLRPRPARRREAPVQRAPASAGTGYPDSFAAFRDYLATSPDLPECGWPGERILPTGSQAPKLMIVLPAPDAAREGEAPLGADAMTLLGNMMRAIGLDLDECHIACLSLIAPPGGMIPPEMTAALARRMRHHIALVAPRALLMAGDQTSRALAPTDMAGAPKNLLSVNHQGGMVAGAAILHPRLMLGQPSAKAEAWRALRYLAKGWGQ